MKVATDWIGSPEVKTLCLKCLHNPWWAVAQFSSKETQGELSPSQAFLVADFILDNEVIETAHSELVYKAKKHFVEEALKLVAYSYPELDTTYVKRCHATIMDFKAVPGMHRDNDGDFTSVVIMCAYDWTPSWGGNLRVGKTTVPFESGKMVAFPSYTEHTGTPPSITAKEHRLVINLVLRNKHESKV